MIQWLSCINASLIRFNISLEYSGWMLPCRLFHEKSFLRAYSISYQCALQADAYDPVGELYSFPGSSDSIEASEADKSRCCLVGCLMSKAPRRHINSQCLKGWCIWSSGWSLFLPGWSDSIAASEAHKLGWCLVGFVMSQFCVYPYELGQECYLTFIVVLLQSMIGCTTLFHSCFCLCLIRCVMVDHDIK
jgi:hypothetical protein